MSDMRLSAAAIAASGTGAPVVAGVLGVGSLVARGPDAGPFLHGQLAADVAGLATGRATRSLLLNHRGHAMAEATVARDSQEWLVIVEDDMLDWVHATLAEHIIFDDVTLARGAAATVTVQGAGALAALNAVLPEVVLDGAPDAGAPVKGVPFWRGVHVSGLSVVVYPRRRSAAGGYDLTLLGADRPAPGGSHVAAAAQDAAANAAADAATDAAAGAAADAAALAAAALEAAARSLVAELVAAGAVAVTSAAIDAARVAARVTTAGRDGGAGVLPQEADLTSAVSYRKGCYLGQEVMARIEARGNLKRGLATLELVARRGDDAVDVEAPYVEAGTAGADEAGARAIELNGRTVGVLGTTALMPDGRVLALGVVRRDLEEGTVVTAGGRELR
ncbi:MAG TPA: hypothetical protein VFN03_00575, partial [Trueperaceae bacterium]|nr:hypothetical protein [Trueperaceae bacterium]